MLKKLIVIGNWQKHWIKKLMLRLLKVMMLKVSIFVPALLELLIAQFVIQNWPLKAFVFPIKPNGATAPHRSTS